MSLFRDRYTFILSSSGSVVVPEILTCVAVMSMSAMLYSGMQYNKAYCNILFMSLIKIVRNEHLMAFCTYVRTP